MRLALRATGAVGLAVGLLLAASFCSGPAHAAVLSVADIVGGGNGLGTGSAAGIEAHNGNIVTSQGGGPQYPANPGDYYAVASYPMVDGVFVPNGTIGPQQISSTGITFDFVGQADANASYNDFFNAQSSGQLGMQNPSSAGGLPDFFSPGHSIIGSHAQKAITFDLDAVRSGTGQGVGRFTAIIGDSRPKAGGSISYYVLVDGVDKAHGFAITNNEDYVDVALSGSDRFLTLVMADANNSINSDHGYFGDPLLHVPEPSTLLVWALGLACLGLYGWRKRRGR